MLESSLDVIRVILLYNMFFNNKIHVRMEFVVSGLYSHQWKLCNESHRTKEPTSSDKLPEAVELESCYTEVEIISRSTDVFS